MLGNARRCGTLCLSILIAAIIAQTGRAESRNAMGYIDVTLPAYGADGNDSNDDLAAIEAAVSDCETLLSSGENPVLYFPPAENYRISRTLEIPAGISVIQKGPILYTGAYNETALRIGTPGVGNTRVMLEGLYVTRETKSDWSSEDCVGIELINLMHCNVEVRRIMYFAIGLRVIGNDGGFGYNMVSLGLLGGNKVGLELTNTAPGPAKGWCNENIFLNGEFRSYSNANPTLNRYGVRIGSLDGDYYGNNNNFFIKPSFELGSTSSISETIAIDLQGANCNRFISLRFESGDYATLLKCTNGSSGNMLEVGSQAGGDLAATGESAALNNLITDRKRFAKREPVFDSGYLPGKACYYDGNSKVHIAGLHAAQSWPYYSLSLNPDDVILKRSEMTLGDRYVDLNGTAVGVFISTSEHKQFVVRRDTVDGYAGRLMIRCYDANGNILDGSTEAYCTFGYWINAYGGCFLQGSDFDSDCFFGVTDEVASIAIMFKGGSNHCRLSRFWVYATDGTMGRGFAWPGYEAGLPGANLATTPPSAGTWSKGKIVLNDDVQELGAAGNKYIINGWRCIASGTPGVWVEMRELTGN